MNIHLPQGYSLQDWPSAWATGDQDRFVPLANDHDVWKNLADNFPHPYTLIDAEAWVAMQSGVHPSKHFAICDSQGPIGSIGLTTREGDQSHSAEVGYWLGKHFWGRGITTASLQAVTVYSFDTLGLVRIEARVHPSNGASIRVLEKLGYQREGLLRSAVLKGGVPQDVLLYASLKPEPVQQSQG